MSSAAHEHICLVLWVIVFLPAVIKYNHPPIVPTVMDLIDCHEVCYLDVGAPEIHVVACSLKVWFASSTAGRTKLRIFLLRQ
eukprot:scaffold5605_cov105-Skeletonema_dohrnii-CCMP3373.AAC.3